MTMFAIIREYSTYEGTFQSNECVVDDVELANVAVDYFEKQNQKWMKEYENYVNVVHPNWLKKNPEPKKEKHTEAQYNEAIRQWLINRMNFEKATEPKNDCREEYHWFYQEIEQKELKDFVT